jgi:FkbM family methyltransferase
LKLAVWVATVTPRGKGFFPRQMGRLLKPWIHHSMVTRHGALLPIVPEALDVFTSMVRQGGSWDYWVFRAINERLPNGSVVYDIGANVGYISLELAHARRGDRVRVISFEPQKDLAANIRSAKVMNGLDNIDVFSVAVGAEDAIIPFFHTSHSVHSSALAPRERARSGHVQQKSIDSLVNGGEIPPPTFMKIDIEGYELAALRGARQTIERHRPSIIFEYSWTTIWGGTSASEFRDFFDGMRSYDLCRLDGRILEPAVWDLAEGAHLDVLARPMP